MWILALIAVGIFVAIGVGTGAPMKAHEGELGNRLAVMTSGAMELAFNQHAEGVAWYLYKSGEALESGGLQDWPEDFNVPYELFIAEIKPRAAIFVHIATPGVVDATVRFHSANEWRWSANAEFLGTKTSNAGAAGSRGAALMEAFDWIKTILGFEGVSNPEFGSGISEKPEPPPHDVPIPTPDPEPPKPGIPLPPLPDVQVEDTKQKTVAGITIVGECAQLLVKNKHKWLNRAAPEVVAAIDADIFNATELADAVFGILLECNTDDLLIGMKPWAEIAPKVQQIIDVLREGQYLSALPPDREIALRLVDARLIVEGFGMRYKDWSIAVRKIKTKWHWWIWDGPRTLDADATDSGKTSSQTKARTAAKKRIDELA